MTRHEILRLVTALAWMVAIALRGTERRILRALRRADAIDPGHATAFTPWTPVSRAYLGRLLRAGVVVATAPGRFYLDLDGFARYRRRRRHRAMIVLSVMLPIFFAWWWVNGRR